MSRIKRTHKGTLHFNPIRDVFLNRDGKKIGQVVNWMGRKAYVSWRDKEHYFINHRGFGLDATLLKHLVMQDAVEYIIIEYKGVKGKRYFISLIDEWLDPNKVKTVSHAKDFGDHIETYGIQKVLCEDEMDEVEVV